MVLTKPQFNCLRDICHSRKGVYLQEKKFGITTYAALLTRRLIDVDMTRGNEGMVLQDGGVPVSGFFREIPPDDWEKFANEFLLTSDNKYT